MTLRLLVATAALLTGCATTPQWNYRPFFENHPRSILVVPASNTTTAVDAPEIWSTTVTTPLAERGYYVFPVYLTADLLKDLGLTNEALLEQLAPNRFKEIFGADSVFFVTIHDWSTKYLVLTSNVTVGVSYKLVDTRTGLVLWQGEQKVIRQSGGGGGGIAGLIVAAVNALATTAIDYRPLAREANTIVVGAEKRGLPAGPYHPEYQKDYAKYRDVGLPPPVQRSSPGLSPKQQLHQIEDTPAPPRAAPTPPKAEVPARAVQPPRPTLDQQIEDARGLRREQWGR